MHTTADFAVALLTQYSFDLGGYTARQLVDDWLNDYPANWIYQGVIEALYQGRYKAISVTQLLAAWNRRGQALYHFNHEFERLICSKFPQKRTEPPHTSTLLTTPVPDAVRRGNQRDHSVVTEAGADTDKSFEQVDPLANLTSTSRGHEELAQRKINRIVEDNQKASPKSDNRLPIEQFTPATDLSDFYTKLRAIAQQLKE